MNPIGLAESVRLLRTAHEREGDATVEWVLSKIKREDFQLWRGERSAIVTNLVDVGNGRHLVWLFAGGNLAEISKVMKPQIEEWAKNVGCLRATMTARPGWSRTLKDYNKRKPVVLSKEL